jgi:hypothetical protein
VRKLQGGIFWSLVVVGKFVAQRQIDTSYGMSKFWEEQEILVKT